MSQLNTEGSKSKFNNDISGGERMYEADSQLVSDNKLDNKISNCDRSPVGDSCDVAGSLSICNVDNTSLEHPTERSVGSFLSDASTSAQQSNTAIQSTMSALTSCNSVQNVNNGCSLGLNVFDDTQCAREPTTYVSESNNSSHIDGLDTSIHNTGLSSIVETTSLRSQETGCLASQLTTDSSPQTNGHILQALPPVEPIQLFNPFRIYIQSESLMENVARVEPSPERVWLPKASPILSPPVPQGSVLSPQGSDETLSRQQSNNDDTQVAASNIARICSDSRLHSISTSSDSERCRAKEQPEKVQSLPSTPSPAMMVTVKPGNIQNNIQKLKALFGDTPPKLESRSQSDSSAEKDTSLSRFVGSKVHGNAETGASKGKKLAVWNTKPHSGTSPLIPHHKKQTTSTTDKESSQLKSKDVKAKKGKVVKTFKNPGVSHSASAAATTREIVGAIGVALDQCVSTSSVDDVNDDDDNTDVVNMKYVPLLVDMCVRIVEAKGLDNQGIYRVPGNCGVINMLVDELNKDPVGLCQDNDKWQDVNVVSAILKLFFRKLPDSLITDELYDLVIAAHLTDNSEKRMLKLKKLIHELPEYNYHTLHYLAQHLQRVASHEDVNKMDVHNLSMLFGPSIIRPQDDSVVVAVRDMSGQCKVIESIILHCEWFFSSALEDVIVPTDEDSESAVPITTMKQEMLAKAERLGDWQGRSRDAINSKQKKKVFKVKLKDKRNKSEDNLLRDLSLESVPEMVDSTIESPTSSVADSTCDEIDFKIVRLPAYHFTDEVVPSTDNAYKTMKRAKSSDSLAVIGSSYTLPRPSTLYPTPSFQRRDRGRSIDS